MNIGIIGLGFVGSAIKKSFDLKKIKTFVYDKYKNGGIGNIENILDTNILFLCLPTLFNKLTNKYDKTSIREISEYLKINNYNGIIILKSTVEPETTEKLSQRYNLKYIHNPEFLSAKTAFIDFHNQKHIVLGSTTNCNNIDIKTVTDFYDKYYSNSNISLCSSLESESMKIFCNSFYASKIQIFNEYYLLCKKNGANYNKIKKLMLKNGWINRMHTDVPGSDGKLSYGGACFPKDTNALKSYMEKNNTLNNVLSSVIKERNLLREEINKLKNRENSLNL